MKLAVVNSKSMSESALDQTISTDTRMIKLEFESIPSKIVSLNEYIKRTGNDNYFNTSDRFRSISDHSSLSFIHLRENTNFTERAFKVFNSNYPIEEIDSLNSQELRALIEVADYVGDSPEAISQLVLTLVGRTEEHHQEFCKTYGHYVLSLGKFLCPDQGTLLHFLSCLSDVRKIQLNNISNIGVCAISVAASKLESLNLYLCSEIDSYSLSALAEGCTKLQTLELGFNAVWTGEELIPILKNCANLRSLRLAHTTNVENSLLSDIAAYRSELELLHLHECNQISDSGIQALVNGCKQLRELVLFNTRVTRVGAQAIVTAKLNKLEVLNLNQVNLTDEDLRQLVPSLPSLKKLFVVNCNNITEEAIQGVLRPGLDIAHQRLHRLVFSQ